MKTRPRVLEEVKVKGTEKLGFGRGYSAPLCRSFLDLRLHAVSPVVPFIGLIFCVMFS